MRFILGLVIGLLVGSGVMPVKHAMHVMAHEIAESIR